MNKVSSTLSRGFTLIELLVVIAVLGLLAAVVLVALDPIEQTNRGRDSGKVSTISQLGRALQAYATANGGVYPDAAGGAWMDELVASGDVKREVEVESAGSANCTTAEAGNICYATDGTNENVVVWTNLQSKKSRETPDTPCTTSEDPIAVYSSQSGRAGIACVANVNSVDVNITIY